VKFNVPYCSKHAKESKRNETVLMLSMLIPFFLFTIMIVIMGIKGKIKASGFLYYVLIYAGYLILAGVLGMVIALIVKGISSLFSKSFKDTPFFTSSGALGIKADMRLDKNGNPFAIELTVLNREVAEELKKLNRESLLPLSTEFWT
jgi:hypothetical protein